MHCGCSRRREWAERISEDILAEDLPYLMSDTNKTSKKLNKLQDKLKEIHHETHYNQAFKRQSENHESSKKEANCHIKRILNKIISRFFIRNFGSQKTVSQYIQSSKREKNKNKKLSTKNYTSSNALFQK